MNEKRFTMTVRRPRTQHHVKFEGDQTITDVVILNGVSEDEPLTPALARRALRVSRLSTPAEVWSNDAYGYRVYARSARKVYEGEQNEH